MVIKKRMKAYEDFKIFYANPIAGVLCKDLFLLPGW